MRLIIFIFRTLSNVRKVSSTQTHTVQTYPNKNMLFNLVKQTLIKSIQLQRDYYFAIFKMKNVVTKLTGFMNYKHTISENNVCALYLFQNEKESSHIIYFIDINIRFYWFSTIYLLIFSLNIQKRF